MIALIVMTAVAASASGTANGGATDVWLVKRAMAEKELRGRFNGIELLACQADRSSAHQGTDWWNRFRCSGLTDRGVAFTLVYRATGKCDACWTVTNVKGATAAGLRGAGGGGSVGRPSAPPVQPPSSAVCRITYRNAGLRVGFGGRIDFGEYLTLDDGSVWETGLGERFKTISFTRFNQVLLVDSGNVRYPCKMINLQTGDTVVVRLAEANRCGGSYYPNGGRIVRLSSREDYGAVLILTDGSVWGVSSLGRYKTSLWQFDDLMVLDGSGIYPYKCMLVNLDDGDAVDVQRLG